MSNRLEQYVRDHREEREGVDQVHRPRRIVTIDLRALNLPAVTPSVINLITGETLPATLTGSTLTVSVSFQAGGAAALELE